MLRVNVKNNEYFKVCKILGKWNRAVNIYVLYVSYCSILYGVILSNELYI